MSLVVQGICRYTLNGTIGQRPWANIWDMYLDTTGTLIDRDEWVFDTAGHILNSYVDEVLAFQIDNLSLDSVSWVDLNSLSGSSGSRTVTDKYTLPLDGNNTASPAGGQVSALVTKQVQSSRSRRNGRLYMTGLDDADVSIQNLAGGVAAQISTRWNQFLTAVNDEGTIPGGATRQAHVVHTTGENPTTGTSSEILSMQCQETIATQRRRVRG